MRFEHVLVVGAGQMGGGIAQVVAASGRRVCLHDPSPGAVERGVAAMGKSLASSRRAIPTGTSGACPTRRRLVPADLMVEAIVEDPAAKEDLFRRADEAFPPDAILASNTSSIPIRYARRGDPAGPTA